MFQYAYLIYNRCFFWKTLLWKELIDTFLIQTLFLRRYYTLNDLLWQDGFLFDFLQKKFIDKWLRKFVIYSGYIYSERLLFDWVVRFYLDLVIWVGQKNNIFEFSNVAFTLVILLLVFMSLFLLISLLYFTLLI